MAILIYILNLNINIQYAYLGVSFVDFSVRVIYKGIKLIQNRYDVNDFVKFRVRFFCRRLSDDGFNST